VGAAYSRDHLISRLKVAPTGFFYGNLDFPDERHILFTAELAEQLIIDWMVRMKTLTKKYDYEKVRNGKNLPAICLDRNQKNCRRF